MFKGHPPPKAPGQPRAQEELNVTPLRPPAVPQIRLSKETTQARVQALRGGKQHGAGHPFGKRTP
jgi:hypothetical protein